MALDNKQRTQILLGLLNSAQGGSAIDGMDNDYFEDDAWEFLAEGVTGRANNINARLTENQLKRIASRMGYILAQREVHKDNKNFFIDRSNQLLTESDSAGFFSGEPVDGTSFTPDGSGVGPVGPALAGINVLDEGVSVGDLATDLNFVGDGVEVTGDGPEKTITIAGVDLQSGRSVMVSPTGTPAVTLTLPADYRTYEILFLHWIESNIDSEFTITPGDLPETGTRRYRSGGRVRLNWAADIRTIVLTGVAQGSEFRDATLFDLVGPPGPPGKDGEPGLPVFRGSWAADTHYLIGSRVVFGGAILDCRVENTDSVFDPEKWQNARGEDGNDGDDGEPGRSVYQGAWVAGENNEVGDRREYLGAFYDCKTANSDNTFDPEKWIPARGKPGEDGEASANISVGDTITGDGTEASPYNVAKPFSDALANDIAQNKAAVAENASAIAAVKTTADANKTAIAENKTNIEANKQSAESNKTAVEAIKPGFTFTVSPQFIIQGQENTLVYNASWNIFPAGATHIEVQLNGFTEGARRSITNTNKLTGRVSITKTFPADNTGVSGASAGFIPTGAGLVFYDAATGGNIISSHTTGITVYSTETAPQSKAQTDAAIKAHKDDPDAHHDSNPGNVTPDQLTEAIKTHKDDADAHQTIPEFEANPTDAATDELEKLNVKGTVYSVLTKSMLDEELAELEGAVSIKAPGSQVGIWSTTTSVRFSTLVTDGSDVNSPGEFAITVHRDRNRGNVRTTLTINDNDGLYARIFRTGTTIRFVVRGGAQTIQTQPIESASTVTYTQGQALDITFRALDIYPGGLPGNNRRSITFTALQANSLQLDYPTPPVYGQLFIDSATQFRYSTTDNEADTIGDLTVDALYMIHTANSITSSTEVGVHEGTVIKVTAISNITNGKQVTFERVFGTPYTQSTLLREVALYAIENLNDELDGKIFIHDGELYLLPSSGSKLPDHPFLGQTFSLTANDGSNGLGFYHCIVEGEWEGPLGETSTVPPTSTVSTDDTITGDGSTSSPLAVAKPYTDAAETQIETNKTNIATNTSAIAAVKTTADDNETDIATNKANIETNKTGLAAVKATADGNATKITTNETGIAANKADIAVNKTAIETNKQAINTLNTNVTTNRTNIANLMSKVESNEQEINTQITIEPSFEAGETAAKTLTVTFRHPANTYSANTMYYAIGSVNGTVTYDPAQTTQDLTISLTADQVKAMNDAGSLDAGDNVEVFIRLQTDADASTAELSRYIYVPVRTAEASDTGDTTGQSAEQVAAAIKAHKDDADAHQTIPDIPDLPDAPANTSEAVKYELEVPATSGDAKWTKAPAAAGGGGGSNKVIAATTSHAFTGRFSSFRAIGGLSATITPSSNTKKILIHLVGGRLDFRNDTNFFNIQILQGTTVVGTFTTRVNNPGNSGMQFIINNITTHSPATTNAVTYTAQFLQNGLGNNDGLLRASSGLPLFLILEEYD